jgi:hypothetical protein
MVISGRQRKRKRRGAYRVPGSCTGACRRHGTLRPGTSGRTSEAPARPLEETVSGRHESGPRVADQSVRSSKPYLQSPARGPARWPGQSRAGGRARGPDEGSPPKHRPPTDVERVARTFHGAHLVAQLRSSPLSNRPANHLRTGEVIVVAQHSEYPVAGLQPAQSSHQRRDEPLRRESHEVASESYQVWLLFVYQPDDLLQVPRLRTVVQVEVADMHDPVVFEELWEGRRSGMGILVRSIQRVSRS